MSSIITTITLGRGVAADLWAPYCGLARGAAERTASPARVDARTVTGRPFAGPTGTGSPRLTPGSDNPTSRTAATPAPARHRRAPPPPETMRAGSGGEASWAGRRV